MLWVVLGVVALVWWIAYNYIPPHASAPVEARLDWAIRHQRRVNKRLKRELERLERQYPELVDRPATRPGRDPRG